MKVFLGLGSNLGSRRENLERAAKEAAKLSQKNYIRVSPIYETPALVPENAPKEWRIPYLNAAAEIDFPGSPAELLQSLKKSEKALGRAEAARWAPRVIDLDILLWGQETLSAAGLTIPHPGLVNRSFVLEPLKDLAPLLQIPGANETVLSLARKTKRRTPWIMGILNVTPDSFSDGGEAMELHSACERIARMEELGIHAIDIGAESTRPGAESVLASEEKRRLDPIFEFLKSRYKYSFFRPQLSIDTRHPSTAALALENGFDIVNDVSGLHDPEMLEVLKGSNCGYVLMHSLDVPANPNLTLPGHCDPLHALREWLLRKLEQLDSAGVHLGRILFDPGIGFGKTAAQSTELLKRIEEFRNLPVRLLVGHSRKSFLKSLGATSHKSRDSATLALSLELARRGVDVLRVHDFESHKIALQTEAEVFP